MLGLCQNICNNYCTQYEVCYINVPHSTIQADYCRHYIRMLEPLSTDGGCFGRCTGLPLFKAIIANIGINLHLKAWGHTNFDIIFFIRLQVTFRPNWSRTITFLANQRMESGEPNLKGLSSCLMVVILNNEVTFNLALANLRLSH